MDRGDRESITLLLQGDIGPGFHLLGSEFGFSEDQGQRHGETRGVRRADQLLGVRARLAFKAAGEAVRIIVGRAAFGRDGTLAILDATLPFRRSMSRCHTRLPAMNEQLDSLSEPS